MIEWKDISDGKTRFFNGQLEDANEDLSEVLIALLTFIDTEIVGRGNARQFDCLFLEVNCDTGRVIAAAGTMKNHAQGLLDGCCIRSQKLQDIWYDLLESNISEKEFSKEIIIQIKKLGIEFRKLVSESQRSLRSKSKNDAFEFMLFSSEPGVILMKEIF